MQAEALVAASGSITAGIKAVSETDVGDTITEERRQAVEALPGFKPSVPVVFCGLFPSDAADFEDLRESSAKLRLNESQVPPTPPAGELGGALGRFPLRFPRPAADSRGGAGATRARVQPRPVSPPPPRSSTRCT